jgi:anaerobic ribonucleoside-triphosphate reductase activating protein
LGPGRRAGIWFQGCAIRCRGCVSQDTWQVPLGEPLVDVDVVIGWVASHADLGLNGVTISGGEPFDQPEALERLLVGIRAVGPDWDVLVYSGYALSRLRGRHGDLVELFDAVLSGPFVASRPTSLPWRGSANQVLTLLTDRARERFAVVPGGESTLQMSVDGGRIWITGIPQREDLNRFEQLLLDRGIALGEVSWRA